MPYARFLVYRRESGYSMVVPNANSRLNVYDAAGTSYEIVNTPDAAPPTGRVPAIQRTVPETTRPCDWFYTPSPINPIPAPGTPVVTITQPNAPYTANLGVPVQLAATGTIGGLPASQLVSWSSSLDGVLGVGASLIVSKLRVGIHTVTASLDNYAGTVATDTETVTIVGGGTPPTVTITIPATNITVLQGTFVQFAGSATDPEDGRISDAIVWTSDLQKGVLYTGQTFTTNELVVGTHIITARALDSGSPPSEGLDSVQVVVVAPPEPDKIPLPDGVVLGVGGYGVINGQ